MSEHILVVSGEFEDEGEPCRDDMTYRIECPGVSDECRMWIACSVCHPQNANVSTELDDLLHREGQAHGVEHRWINGCWMTATDRCFVDWSDSMSESAEELGLSNGRYPVDYDFEEEYVHLSLIAATP